MREALILTFSDAFPAIDCCFVVATSMVPLMRNAARAAAPSADAH
jgi:MFS transporter, DHA2 family, multidrug resistance protein